MKNCERGRSMIEMLGVLAIVGILSVGGISGYSKAMQKVRRDKLVTQISTLVMSIRTMFINQKNYSGLSNRLLVEIGVSPTEMYDQASLMSSNVSLTHALNGGVYVFPSLNDLGELGAFEVYMTELSSLDCFSFATMDWGFDQASGFEALYIGAGDVTGALMRDIHLPMVSSPENGIYTPGEHEDSVPLTINGARSACACSGKTCVIGFKYL